MILTIILVIIDQLSKILISKGDVQITLIKNLLNITYVENRGMVFGVAQGSVYIMGAISFVVCIALIAYIVKLKKDRQNVENSIYMILAGGIGNMIDRLFRGYVIDFIDTPFIATFNLADSFVVIGVILLSITYIYREFKNDVMS